MGRKREIENPVSVTIRIEEDFMSNKPDDIKNGEFLRDILHERTSYKFTSGSLNGEDTKVLEYFGKLFGKLFAAGKLDKYLKEDKNIMNMAKKYEELLNKCMAKHKKD